MYGTFQLMNVIAGSPEELADVIESRLMSEYEIEIPSVNFGIQVQSTAHSQAEPSCLPMSAVIHPCGT